MQLTLTSLEQEVKHAFYSHSLRQAFQLAPPLLAPHHRFPANAVLQTAGFSTSLNWAKPLLVSRRRQDGNNWITFRNKSRQQRMGHFRAVYSTPTAVGARGYWVSRVGCIAPARRLLLATHNNTFGFGCQPSRLAQAGISVGKS